MWFLFLPQIKFGEPLDQDSQEVFGWICQFISDFKKVYSEYAQWTQISIDIWYSRCSYVWICTCLLKHVNKFLWEGDWTVGRNRLICRLRPLFSGCFPALVFGLIKSLGELNRVRFFDPALQQTARFLEAHIILVLLECAYNGCQW